MSGAFCDGFKIGFCIFSIEDKLYYIGFRVERCIVLRYRQHIVCGGIHVTPRDGGIFPVNGHVRAVDVNAKGSD